MLVNQNLRCAIDVYAFGHGKLEMSEPAEKGLENAAPEELWGWSFGAAAQAQSRIWRHRTNHLLSNRSIAASKSSTRNGF